MMVVSNQTRKIEQKDISIFTPTVNKNVVNENEVSRQPLVPNSADENKQRKLFEKTNFFDLLSEQQESDEELSFNTNLFDWHPPITSNHEDKPGRTVSGRNRTGRKPFGEFWNSYLEFDGVLNDFNRLWNFHNFDTNSKQGDMQCHDSFSSTEKRESIRPCLEKCENWTLLKNHELTCDMYDEFETWLSSRNGISSTVPATSAAFYQDTKPPLAAYSLAACTEFSSLFRNLDNWLDTHLERDQHINQITENTSFTGSKQCSFPNLSKARGAADTSFVPTNRPAVTSLVCDHISTDWRCHISGGIEAGSYFSLSHEKNTNEDKRQNLTMLAGSCSEQASIDNPLNNLGQGTGLPNTMTEIMFNGCAFPAQNGMLDQKGTLVNNGIAEGIPSVQGNLGLLQNYVQNSEIVSCAGSATQTIQNIGPLISVTGEGVLNPNTNQIHTLTIVNPSVANLLNGSVVWLT